MASDEFLIILIIFNNFGNLTAQRIW